MRCRFATKQGKISEAVLAYRKAIELRPDYAQAHNGLGTALRRQGKLVEAIAAFRRTLELVPDHAEARKNLIDTLRQEQSALSWGDEVEGVQARLRPKKAASQATEAPAFDLELRNQGKLSWQGVATPHHCELQVDGKWYKNGANFPGAPATALKPGMDATHWVDVSLGGQWYKPADEKGKAAEEDKPGGKGGPIVLAPGKHTVRLAYRLTNTRVGEGKPEIRVLTNAVEIEIQAEAKSPVEKPAWGKALNGLRLGLYQTDPKGDGKPRLVVVLENVSSEDLVLKLGKSFAKGKKHQLTTVLRLHLTDPDGRERVLDSKGPIHDDLRDGALVSPFVIQLVAGGRYVIPCDLNEFFDGKDVKATLPPGRYRAAGEFVGRAVTKQETGTGSMSYLASLRYWTGTVHSDAIQVTLPAKPAK
jgi:Tetratricopeptide repeat